MSKTKHKYNREDDYGRDGERDSRPNNRHKEKRIQNALKTKNIDELMDLDDNDPDYYYDEEDYYPQDDHQ